MNENEFPVKLFQIIALWFRFAADIKFHAFLQSVVL